MRGSRLEKISVFKQKCNKFSKIAKISQVFPIQFFLNFKLTQYKVNFLLKSNIGLKRIAGFLCFTNIRVSNWDPYSYIIKLKKLG